MYVYDTHFFTVNFLLKLSDLKKIKTSEHTHTWGIHERKRPTGPHTLGWADITGRKDYVSREGCILRALLKSRVSNKSFATRVSLSSASTRHTETWHVQLPGAVFHWCETYAKSFSSEFCWETLTVDVGGTGRCGYAMDWWSCD